MSKIKNMIPDAITVTSLMLAITAVFKGLEGEWSSVVVLLIVSCILDVIDGRAARYLNVTTPHGELIDSLVDLSCFGVIPAILYYIAFQTGEWALYVYVFVVLLRLLRFHQVPKLTRFTKSGDERNFIMGMAAPIAAIYLLVPIIISHLLELKLTEYEYLYPFYVLLISFLAYAPIPMYSLKYLPKNNSFILLCFFFIISLIAMLIFSPQLYIVVMCALFFVFIPVSCIHYFSLNKDLPGNQ